MLAGDRGWEAQEGPSADRAQNRNIIDSRCKAALLELRVFNWISPRGDSPPLIDATALVEAFS